MSAVARILEEFAAQGTPTPAGRAAAQALREHSLPTRRDENWHYANLRALEQLTHFSPNPQPSPVMPLPHLPDPLPGFERIVYLDGRLQRQHAATAAALARLHDSGLDAPVSAFEAAGDGRFGLVARMFAPEPLSLRVSGTFALEIISLSSAGAFGHYTDLNIELAPDARLELVEHLAGSGPEAAGAEPSALTCNTLRLRLEAGSQLVHTRLQQAPSSSLLYETVAARLAERATYRLRQLSASAANARSSVQVQLQGRESAVEIQAIAAAQGSHSADTLYTTLHEAPGTRSELLFRGIASERAHAACSADVQVGAEARGSRVLQSLRGLIDGKGAEVNLRPRLTINTDDIQAAHGATTGQLDETLLFYLLSRGLAPEAARSLLKWAFLSEAMGQVGPAALRKRAESAIASRLSDAPAAELLR